MFQSIYTTVTTNIQKYLGKHSEWVIDSIIAHTIIISKYNLLSGSSYFKLPKELDHPKCFKWCLVRYLNPLSRNYKSDKDFVKTLDLN